MYGCMCLHHVPLAYQYVVVLLKVSGYIDPSVFKC